MNKTTAMMTLIALVITFVASSLVVSPELAAFVPSLEPFLTGSVGAAVGSLLTTLLDSFLGLGDISGMLVEVLMVL